MFKIISGFKNYLDDNEHEQSAFPTSEEMKRKYQANKTQQDYQKCTDWFKKNKQT